jgi:hypothetical protein
MALGILSDQQSHLDPGQPIQRVVQPQRRTLLARWQIATIPSSRIAIPHWDDGDTRSVVEYVLVHAHPGAQAISTRIIPRNASRMDPQTGRLPYDKDLRLFAGLQDRARAEWEMLFACPTSTHRTQQRVEGEMGTRLECL